MNRRKSLKLASFDGGGPRSISQLEIMQNIMHRLRYEKYPHEPDKVMLPCEHFDMIGGSDTGGLIAIMFTKLRMSVEDTTDEFCTIFETVYEDRSLLPSDRSTRLRGCMEDLLKRKGVPIDAKLVEGTADVKCIGFVVATPCANVGHTVHFRTYPVRTERPSLITVVDAVLATCASQPAFAPVSFGARHKRQEYIGGAIGVNNPIRDVIAEAHLLFGGDSSIASILSLGCGHPGVVSLALDGDVNTLQSDLQDFLLDCERRAREVQEQIGHLGMYFRFSVEQGIQRPQSAPGEDLSWIVNQTEVYLADPGVNNKIEELLKNWDAGFGLITVDQLKHSGGPKAVYKTAPLLATHYVRRMEPWKQLVSAVASVHEGQKVIILAGMAGCGKTQLVIDLALEYGTGRESRFEYVLFVDGSSETSIQSDLITHVRIALPGSAQINLTDGLNFFQNPANSGWLIVCDNVDDPNIDLRPLLPRCNHGVIVITTRDQLLRKLASQPHFHIQLDVMSEDEATELVVRCAGHQSSSEDEKRAAKQIARKLGYLPVALTQAGCYMSDTGASCCQYLDLVSDHLAELMEKPSGDRQNRSAYAAFDLTYRRLPPAIQDLLHLLSFFHFANFPMVVISHAAKQSFRGDPFPFVKRGVEFEHAVKLLEETFSPGGTWSKLTLPNLIGVLQNYSLASFTLIPLTQLLRIHPLIREWAFDRIPQERRPVFQEAARRLLVCCTDAKRLHHYLPPHIEAVASRPVSINYVDNDHAAFGKILRIAGHLQDAQNKWLPIYNALREEHEADNLHVATAAFELADSYDHADWKQTEALERESLRIRMALLGPQHLETLKVMGNLSGTLSRQARHEEAVAMREEILSGLRSQLPPDHPDIAESMGWLAYAYAQHDKLEEAESLQLQILKEQTIRLGANHLDTLDTAGDLASTYFLQGRYSEAEVLEAVILEGRKDQLGEMHLDTLDAMLNLARTYSNSNRHSEATSLHINVVKGLEEQLGKTHLRTVDAISGLASTYNKQGKYSAAEPLFTQVVEARTAQLGRENLYTIDAMSELAVTYNNQSKYSTAEPLFAQVVEIRKAQLGDTHLKTLDAMLFLSQVYYQQERYSEAEHLQSRVVEQCSMQLGEKHLQTLVAITSLSHTYYNQQCYFLAGSCQTQVVEGRKAQLGETHLETLEAMLFLAQIYFEEGRYSDAESLQVEVMECRQAELGDTHSDTLIAMNNLALTCYSQYRYSEAETLQVEVLETRAWLEGEASLEVATSAHNLAFTYRAMGRLVEARELNERAERIRGLYRAYTP